MNMKKHISGIVPSILGVFILSSLQAASEAGPPLNTGRIQPVCATMDDGRFLVAGGHGTNFTALASAEIGSPEDGAFTQISLPNFFDYGAMARLKDGRYLLAGSAANLGVAPGYNSACIYDPQTDTATSTGNMTYARMNCVAATLADGRVLVVGGWYNSSSPVYGELYDPASGTFTATQALSEGRAIPVVLPANDGRAVVFGGYGAYGGEIKELVEVYDPAVNSFSVLRQELVEGDPGWKTMASAKEVNDMLLDDGRYVFRVYKSGSPAQYGFAFFDPETLACTVDPVPAAVTDGSGIASSGYAIEGNSLYFMLQSAIGSGPATTVRIAAYFVPSGPESTTVGEAFTLNYTPYAPGCTIRNGRFFSAGATTSTGSQANFGAVADTFFADIPDVGPPDYAGWYYVKSRWMYWHEGERWIYRFPFGWAYDSHLDEYFQFGGE